MTAFYRDSPPRLLQEGSKCWSAAAAAWTAVTRGVDEITFIELLDEAKAAKITAWNGALRGDDGIKWLAKRLGLQWLSGTGLAENASILPRLRKSHVIYMFRRRIWKRSVHAVTLWGTDDDIVAFMDPQIGQWTFPNPRTLR